MSHYTDNAWSLLNVKSGVAGLRSLVTASRVPTELGVRVAAGCARRPPVRLHMRIPLPPSVPRVGSIVDNSLNYSYKNLKYYLPLIKKRQQKLPRYVSRFWRLFLSANLWSHGTIINLHFNNFMFQQTCTSIPVFQRAW